MRAYTYLFAVLCTIASLTIAVSSSASTPELPQTGAERVACARFAAPGGSDAHRGTRARPFRTAQRLLRSLRPHQTGCLRGGTYTALGAYVLDFSKSNVTIVSYPGERALLQGIVVNRNGANGNRVAGVTIEGDGSQNTIQVYGDDFTLEASDVTNAWRGRSCLMLGDPSVGAALRPVIRGNRFHECGALANGNKDHGIYANVVDGGLITENVFWNSAAYAIQLYPHAQNTVFSHNVVDGSGSGVRGGVIIGGDTAGTPSSGNTIEYNVISYAVTYNIDSWWGGSIGSNNTVRSNCLFGASIANIGATAGYTMTGNVIADPQFLDRGARDYRLGSGSSCLAVVGYDTAARIG